jgi:hypothetical protein
MHVLYSESESGSGSEKDSNDNSLAVGARVWTKNNFPPRLDIFQGISGVKQVLTDITSVSENFKMFIGSDFKIMRRIIFYHKQNVDKFMYST